MLETMLRVMVNNISKVKTSSDYIHTDVAWGQINMCSAV